MILIRERQKLALDAPTLQRMKRGQALANQQPVVELAVDDELRRAPVLRVPARIPLVPLGALHPRRAAQVVEREVEFLRRHLARHAEHAVVGHERLEPSP